MNLALKMADIIRQITQEMAFVASRNTSKTTITRLCWSQIIGHHTQSIANHPISALVPMVSLISPGSTTILPTMVVTITSSTIEGITGSTAAADITYDGAGNTLDTITVFTSDAAPGNDDTVDVTSTATDSVYSLATQDGDDTVNITSTAPTLLTGNLDAILGQVRVDSGAGADALNISDYTAGVASRIDSL